LSLIGAASEHASTQIRGRSEGRVSSEEGQFANRREVFIVVRQLPETGGMFQYQIKSEIDGHARVVREIQLADLGLGS
jgi:hypothetical protein